MLLKATPEGAEGGSWTETTGAEENVMIAKADTPTPFRKAVTVRFTEPGRGPASKVTKLPEVKFSVPSELFKAQAKDIPEGHELV